MLQQLSSQQSGVINGRPSEATSIQRDFYAGGLVMLKGIGVVVEARSYPVDSLMSMGPGFALGRTER
jgi:hypothetical protein